MDALYTYLLVASAAGCALGGFVGWWMRKQGEAAGQHDVEVYYREALRIAESSRDRAREEADQVGDRMRELREEHDAQTAELEDLRMVLEGLKQAGTDATDRIQELEAEVLELRKRVKERESSFNRLQKEWTAREAELRARNDGGARVERLQAELKAMNEARSSSGAEADRLRKRVQELEAQVEQVTARTGNGNGSSRSAVSGSGSHPIAASSNGEPKWLLPSASGDQDDLKSIHGLGPVLERGLNKLGVYYFRQVAQMTRQDVEWLAPKLNIHPGRILRDDWARQAKECHRRKYKENL